MRYSNRLFLYAPFVALLVIAVIAMLHWRQVANDWQARLLAANSGHEIAPGVTLQFASERIGGFPFNIDVVLEKCVVAVQSTRGPISFASEHFAIHALTYGRAQQVYEAAGVQKLTWTDTEGGAHRFVFVPGSLRASAIETDGRLRRFDLDLNAFASQSLMGARAQLHLRAAPDRDALDFALRGDDLRTRSSPNVLFPHVEIDGRLTPAAPLSPLLSGGDEWRHALFDWRSRNGAVRLDAVDIVWDASHLTGSGVFALDATHRISGELKLRIFDAQQWKPMRVAHTAVTEALQELIDGEIAPRSAPIPLIVTVHNGAATVTMKGNSRAAGAIDSVF